MKPSFQFKLIVGLSVIILFSCSLSGYLAYRAQLKLFEEEVSRQYDKANEQALSHLDLRIGEMYRISNYVVFNSVIEKTVSQLMNPEGLGLYDEYEDHNQLQTLLRQVKLDAPLIDSLYLYDLNGNNYYFGHMKETMGPLDPEVFEHVKKSVQSSSGELVWIRAEVSSTVEKSGKTGVIIASRWMKNRTLGMYGLLVMVLEESLLSAPLQELARGGKGGFYLFDASDRLLYTDIDEEKPPALAELKQGGHIRTVQGEPYLYAVHTSPSFSWTLVSRVSLSSLQERSRMILNLSLYSGLVSIVLSALLIVLLSGRLVRPLKELVKGMREMRGGNFDVRIELRSRDELGFLGESFNTMAANVRSLIQEVYLRQLSEREAELKAIQAQLNPHFLYNTLNGLYWRLYVQEDRETAELVSALSGLLRYSLGRVREDTLLKEELRQTANYLEIQKAFVENRFDAAVEAEEEALSCQVPRLLLQPLVENVFVHAFRNEARDKKLTVRAYGKAGCLMIEIEDNGCGMSEDQIARLLRPISEEEGEKPSIGIRSVLRRLDLVYGSLYGLEMDSRPGEGTKVTLRLPWLQAPPEEKAEPGSGAEGK